MVLGCRRRMTTMRVHDQRLESVVGIGRIVLSALPQDYRVYCDCCLRGTARRIAFLPAVAGLNHPHRQTRFLTVKRGPEADVLECTSRLACGTSVLARRNSTQTTLALWGFYTNFSTICSSRAQSAFLKTCRGQVGRLSRRYWRALHHGSGYGECP